MNPNTINKLVNRLFRNHLFLELKQKIKDKTSNIAVVGLGYVGLPLAVEFAKKGFNVLGLDTSVTKIRKLRQNDVYIQDVQASDLYACVNGGKFTPSRDFMKLTGADVISICVPTPLKDNQSPDLSYIQDSVDHIKKYMKKGVLIILESTTYPGTTEEMFEKSLSECGYEVGVDYFLCFSSERVNPGSLSHSTWEIPKVIGGTTALCIDLATDLYSQIFKEIVPVSSPKVAEMSKLLENTYRSINIAFINEMALLCEKVGISIWETIKAAKTKPFGFMPFMPGPGIGGHCIPLDPIYLSWKAKEMNFFSRFIELAHQINKSMPSHVVEVVSRSLNFQNKAIKESKILVLGLSYKPDINDMRESPSLEIIKLLSESGAVVEFHDPYIPFYLDSSSRMKNTVLLDYNLLPQYDCIVLVTNHTSYDYKAIARQAKLIVDTRNGFEGCESDNITRIGEPIHVEVPVHQL